MGEQSMRTPRWLFDHLQDVFGLRFRLDAFASRENALCQRHYTAKNSALSRRAVDATFSNPPFAMMQQAVDWADAWGKRGVRQVMIAPVIGAQQWAHQTARQWTIYLPDRRISFDNPDGTPTGAAGARDEKGKVKGADRDTSIIVFGPGFENTGDGFKVLSLHMPALAEIGAGR